MARFSVNRSNDEADGADDDEKGERVDTELKAAETVLAGEATVTVLVPEDIAGGGASCPGSEMTAGMVVCSTMVE